MFAKSSFDFAVGRRAMKFVIVLCFVVFASCQSNKWYGKFEGTTTESSQISRLQQNGETKYHTGGRSVNGATVSLMREGSIAFVTIDNCRLRMTLSDTTHANVSDGQTCQISINGYEGKVNIAGSAHFEGNGKLMIQLTGTAIEPNTSGGYAYNFQGARSE